MELISNFFIGIAGFYPFFKAMHVVGFVSWFAGLFFLVRIFVYHAEASCLTSEMDKQVLIKQYKIMEGRVYKIICKPAMMITWSFGLLMIFTNGWEWFKGNNWLHFKLVLLFGLQWYHFFCKKLINYFEKDITPLNSFQFRLFNEVPSVFLVLIALLAVYKNSLNWVFTSIGVFIFILLMYFAAKKYKEKRERIS